MKHNLFFALLLALILSVGFYSMDLADRLIESSGQQAVSIERNKETSRAIYLSEKDSGFDPMSLIKPSNGEIGSYNAEWRSVGSSIVEALSYYSDETRFDDQDVHNLFNAWRISRNSYFYIDKMEYRNPAGEKRFIDCIIHPYSYRVVYIRFYSDKPVSATPEQISLGLETLDNYSQNFYMSVNGKSCNLLDDIYYDQAVGYNDGNEADDAMFPWYKVYCPATNYGELREAFCSKYNTMKELISKNYSNTSIDTPLVRFWINPYYIESIRLNENNKTAFCINYLFDEENKDRIEVTSYSSLNGRIFQNVDLGKQTLIVIYNINDDMIEGFYAPPSSK